MDNPLILPQPSRIPLLVASALSGLIFLTLGFLLGRHFPLRQPPSIPIAVSLTPSPVFPPLSPSPTAILQTYTNTQHGFSVQYGPDIRLYEPKDKDQMVLLSFIPICDPDKSVVCFHYTQPDPYQIPGFEAAGLSINIIPNLTPQDCQIGSSHQINGINFFSVINSEAATGHKKFDFTHRTFHQNSCFEIVVRLTGSSNVQFRPYTQVDNEITDALNLILNSFKFTN